MAILNKLKTIKAASYVVSETMGAVAKKSADEAGDSSTKPSAMTLCMVGNLLKSVDLTAMITRLEVLQRKNGLDLGILLTFLGTAEICEIGRPDSAIDERSAIEGDSADGGKVFGCGSWIADCGEDS